MCGMSVKLSKKQRHATSCTSGLSHLVLARLSSHQNDRLEEGDVLYSTPQWLTEKMLEEIADFAKEV